VGCSDIWIASRTLFQASEHVEDTALAIVQQEDAQIATQVLVPQGVLVVEETEVAYDADNPLFGDTGEACCCGE
jgi:hypothetical protein